MWATRLAVARPTTPAAMLWRQLACTRSRYRKNIFDTLNTNSVSGSTAKITCGGAKCSGDSTIATDQAIAAEQHAQRIDRIQELLAREDVAEQLVLRGVDPVDASERVAALTQEELASLAGQIDNLPAGSDAIAVIGVVFLVLLILELVGVTNIFNNF